MHPLERLAQLTGTQLGGCVSTVIAGCYEPAMLMVERMNSAGRISDTWLVTVVSSSVLRLEAMVAESKLEVLAEGPPDQIVTHLSILAARPARSAAPVMG